MPLAIGLRPKEKFYLGDVPVTALEFKGYEYAKVEVNGKTFEITDKAATEILPRVFVSCGKPASGQLHKYDELAKAADAERERRRELVASGQNTQAEVDSMPPVQIAYQYLPRLMIEAPRSITILRENLYARKRAKR